MKTLIIILCRLATIDAPPTVTPVATPSNQPPARIADLAPGGHTAVPIRSTARTTHVRPAQHTTAAPLDPSNIGGTASAPSAEELREIIQLRRQTSPLRSRLLDDADFANQLKENFGPRPTQPTGELGTGELGTGELGTGELGKSDFKSGAAVAFYRQHALRSLRRRLHTMVQDLDELERPLEAQQLRQFADGLAE